MYLLPVVNLYLKLHVILRYKCKKTEIFIKLSYCISQMEEAV